MLSAIENVAQENHRKILRLKNDAMRSFILLGKELKTNKEEGYFQSLGYPTFEAYIESPELSIGRRSVYSLIAIYDTFVEQLGYSLDELSEVDYSKLDRVIPLINVQPVAHREWFEKAKTLPRRELEREVKQAWRIQRRPQPVSPILPTDGLEGWINTVQCGDCLALLQQLPSESIDCCITSPPYWQMRDYGVEGQLGLETTLEAYLDKMLVITAELKRVLKKGGTMWWTHGDSYGTHWGKRSGQFGNEIKKGFDDLYTQNKQQGDGVYEKSLILQNYRLAIRMVDEQRWLLRNTVVWHKPSCMPSSAKDRFTVDFENLFFFVKHDTYWFEPQYEKSETAGSVHVGRKGDKGSQIKETVNPTYFDRSYTTGALRHKRCVWRIPPQPFPNAHFAVFPEELCETPIKAGCPEFICKKCGVAREKVYEREYLETKKVPYPNKGEIGSMGLEGRAAHMTRDGFIPNRENIIKEQGYTDCGCGAGWHSGIVLDPFCGTGTALVVASKLGRQYIGFDLNPDYVQMATERLYASPRAERSEVAPRRGSC